MRLDDLLFLWQGIRIIAQAGPKRVPFIFQQKYESEGGGDADNAENAADTYVNNSKVASDTNTQSQAKNDDTNREARSMPPTLQQLTASKIPESKLGRWMHYTGLAVRIGSSALGNMTVKKAGAWMNSKSDIDTAKGSTVWSENTIQDLVYTLSKMRGAALKLGQMLSIQGAEMFPPAFEKIIQRVRHAAHKMPTWQMQQVMSQEFGSSWREKFVSFDDEPIAAASIGQVHRGIIRAENNLHIEVAIKIQYPGIEKSLKSDLDHLRGLLVFSKLLPKGLFLDNTIRVAQKELAWELDYDREVSYMREFHERLRQPSLIESRKKADSLYKLHHLISIPTVYMHTKHVLVTEWKEGVPIDKIETCFSDDFPTQKLQLIKNQVGTCLLYLCLKEIFEYGIMQTDPNWSNFLYDSQRHKIVLLDFGACRDFPEDFIHKYRQLVLAASDADRQSCLYWSEKLGFLTGHESHSMIQAHIQALLSIAEPFRSPGLYDFTNYGLISKRVKSTLSTMAHERQRPPPDEAYSLHRKLSGVFLLCARLRAVIPCRDMLGEFAQSQRLIMK